MCFYILCCKITNFRRKDKGFYTGANVFLYENLIFCYPITTIGD